MREIIVETMKRVALDSGKSITEPLVDETILLQCGLDSLGFAILVVRLEENLGFDPFIMTDEPVYPKTLGEFVRFYEKMGKIK